MCRFCRLFEQAGLAGRHGGRVGQGQQHELLVVKVARHVTGRVVQVEAPGVAAMVLAGMRAQEVQPQPDRVLGPGPRLAPPGQRRKPAEPPPAAVGKARRR